MDILKGVNHIHFIGIGGSGMFPIVQILKQKGFKITGSDNNESDIVRLARSLNIKVYMQQKKENINGADLIIYTSAILKRNEELIAAKNSQIPTIERNDFLSYLTKKYENSICICGTHGKTTTTSMLSQIMIDAKKDPSIIVGGKLEAIKGYGKLGNSNILICESCEFEDHFLKLFPTTSIILNIDEDHLDYFKNIENLKNSFTKFCEKTKNLIIYNGDDENTKEVVQKINKKKISFGFKQYNNYFACKIKNENGIKTSFSVFKNNIEILKNVNIFTPGNHNVLNALAAIIAAIENNIDKKHILESLEKFKGAGRRFELIGKIKGITVFDDYAHHPNEIYATLNALKACNFNKIWAIHQPFTYSRTKLLKKEFASALKIADKVIITDILPSREENIYNITAKDLADIIEGSIYIKDQADAAKYVLTHATQGDAVITMGCGDIYKSAKIMIYGKY